jgi:hypothetical protein
MTIILVLAHISFKFCFWFLLASSFLPKMYDGSYGFYIQRFSLTFIDKSSFFQKFCIIFFSSLLISFTIDCEIITSFIEYGFPNITIEQLSDFSINFSGGISTNNVITDNVNNSSSSGTITESTSTVKTTSTVTNNSTPPVNSASDSTNSTSSTSNSSSSTSNSSSSTSNSSSSNQNQNENNKTLYKKSSSTALISSKAADAAIMTTALSASKALMIKAPNLHSKAVIAGSSIMLGATAIIAKNVASNLSFDLGSKKNKFIDLESSLAKFFELTGNSVTDLLILINYMQFLQLIILCFTLYYFILFNISEDKIEFYLMKIFPNIIVSFLIKNVKLLKKTGFILLIILLLFSIISGYLVLNYLDFFLINFDDICEYYIENKNKNK